MAEEYYLPKTQILKHLSFLVESTENLDKVVSFLMSKKIISFNEKETVFGMVEKNTKCDVLYRTVIRKGPNVFLHLIQSLIFSENTAAAKILTDNYKKIIIGGDWDTNEVFLYKFSDIPPSLKSTLTHVELVCTELHRQDLESLGHLTKLQELKLLKFRLFGKLQSTWITKPELRDLKIFHYEEIRPESNDSDETLIKSFKSVFFFSTKNLQWSKFEIRVVIYNVIFVDTTKSLSNHDLSLMTLPSVTSVNEDTDVCLTCDENYNVIEILIKNGEIRAKEIQQCLLTSQKSLACVELFDMENCSILDDFQREIRVSWPKLKRFHLNIKVNPSIIRKSDFFDRIFFFNKFWDIPWALDEIYSLNVNIKVVLNDLFVCGVDHSLPSLNFINRAVAESSEALLESVRNQRLTKLGVISETTVTRSHILSWNQNIQPQLLTQFTFIGPYTTSLSALLKKCDGIRQLSIWNKRQTIAQKVLLAPFQCGLNSSSVDSIPNPTDSFDLKQNYVHVSLHDLDIRCINYNSVSVFDQLEQLHLHNCNAESLLNSKENQDDNDLNILFPTLKEISIVGGKNPNQLKPPFLSTLLEMNNLESIFLCKFQWGNSKSTELGKQLLNQLELKGTEKNFILGKVPSISRKSEIPECATWKSRIPKSTEYQQILYYQFKMNEFFEEVHTFASHSELYGVKTKL